MRPARRGAATLLTVMGLFVAMALVAAHAHRNLLVEQRIARQVRDGLEAAEMARLGHDQVLNALNGLKLDERCQPDAAARDRLRERLLHIDAKGAITPRSTGFQLVCDRGDGRLDCQCPAAGRGAVLRDETESRTSSVRVALAAVPAPGELDLVARGCSRASRHCPVSLGASDDLGYAAQSTQRLRLHLLSALKSPPAQALVATGSITLVRGAAGPLSGMSIRAGGAITTEPGVLRSGWSEGEPALAALSPAAFFQRHFGLSPTGYREHPALSELPDCGSDCARRLAELVAAGAQIVWVDGDLVIDAPLSLGDADRPLLLLVQGAVDVKAELHLRGLLYVGRGGHWRAPGSVDGALLVAGDWTVERDFVLRHDQSMLSRLRQAGSFVRVPGGLWSEP